VTVQEPWRSGSEVPVSSPNAHSVLCSCDIPFIHVKESTRVLPEYMVAYDVRLPGASRTLDEPDSALTAIEEKILAPQVALPGLNNLSDIERRMQREFWRFEQHLFEEMDPGTAKSVEESDQEMKRLQETLDSLMLSIQKERTQQESILREFRLHLNAPNVKKNARSASGVILHP